MSKTVAGPCRICNGPTHPCFAGNPDILECEACGVIHDTRSVFDTAFYENERPHNINSEKLKSRMRNVRQRAGLIGKFIRESDTLLDIGCGEGLFIKEVKGMVNDVKGIEPTVFYANYANRELGIDVRQGAIEDIEFMNDSFNIITMFHVLEHLNDPAGCLKKIHSWLRPGGYIVIEVPDIKSPAAVYKGEAWELITPEHRFHFSRNSLVSLLRKAGFAPVKIAARDFDQYRGNIGKSLGKLLPLFRKKRAAKHQAAKEANSKARPRARRDSALKRIRNNIQLPLKLLLGWLVLRFNKGDYLFVVAEKKRGSV
ncbi:MAG: class I SAM-dependent methyltransferase [Nitrospirae bacterium]|nr:class I SAM-dependent methyltransferase [Nitrospirota bacterium]